MEKEQHLQCALVEAEEHDTKCKHAMIHMQSITILQNAHIRKVNRQLHAQKEKEEI